MRKINISYIKNTLTLITMLVLLSSCTMFGPGFSTTTPLSGATITANTGEKPQSKVWTHDGKWWMVMPNSTGTHVFRLDGTTWTSVLDIDASTTAHADCKVVGNVTHILLYNGTSSSLVSVEYASNTYQLWASRNTPAAITLDTGVETASIDIDGNGRMWLASDGTTEINVRYSNFPYSTWSAPITIGTGVSSDDICVVTALNVKIGVLWSNQTTDRFGFKYHTDGDAPATWSADEVPASQSAQPIGNGMADDHLNIAVASDGTIYAAVKTSYDTSGNPIIAMLIRRPVSGTWDNLYEVSETGTRPIVILNETEDKVKVIYTDSESGGNIVYKESGTSSISFSSALTLISGSNNNPTSSKQNYSDKMVVMASTASTLVSVLASDVRETFTVTYDGNTSDTGSVPVDSSSPYITDTTVTVLGEGDLVKTDNTFAGWNTQAGGNGTDYAEAATFNITENTTLYAQWDLVVIPSASKQVNSLQIFPNPATSEVSLSFDQPTVTGDIQEFDVTGRLVKTIK